MKKILPAILLAATILSSCVKKDNGCTPQDPSAEKPSMISYCNTYGIGYTEHSSGILYQVTNPGSGVTPTASSRIFIYYTGKFLSGSTFETQNDPSKTGWTLNTLIDGWKIGIPLIKKGGSVKLIIPSYLAYSCNGYGSIPGNTPLCFEITLVDVQ
jgi:FKBP-type peptidyl-prolyl cis-trans isomerase FkpA